MSSAVLLCMFLTCITLLVIGQRVWIRQWRQFIINDFPEPQQCIWWILRRTRKHPGTVFYLSGYGQNPTSWFKVQYMAPLFWELQWFWLGERRFRSGTNHNHHIEVDWATRHTLYSGKTMPPTLYTKPQPPGWEGPCSVLTHIHEECWYAPISIHGTPSHHDNPTIWAHGYQSVWGTPFRIHLFVPEQDPACPCIAFERPTYNKAGKICGCLWLASAITADRSGVLEPDHSSQLIATLSSF